MAEINSVEAVRQKLREFDEQMRAVIAAGYALARIRTDAGRLRDELKELTDARESEVKSLSGIKAALKESRIEWSSLNKELKESLVDSKDAREKLDNARSSALRSVDSKLAAAENRLLSACRVRFANQEHILVRLEAGTQTNAEIASNAAAAAKERAEHLQNLVQCLSSDLQREGAEEVRRIEKLLDDRFKQLQGDFDTKSQSCFRLLEAALTSNEKSLREETSARKDEQQHVLAGIDDHVKAAVASLEERFSNYSRETDGGMASFKDEIAASLREQHEAMARQVTDFLNKQNALVQNLTQQIDAYQRAASTQSAVLSDSQTKMSELSAALRRCQETAARQFEESRSEVAALRRSTNEINVGLQEETRARRLHEGIVQALGSRLEETLKKLKNLPIFGKAFK